MTLKMFDILDPIVLESLNEFQSAGKNLALQNTEKCIFHNIHSMKTLFSQLNVINAERLCHIESLFKTVSISKTP